MDPRTAPLTARAALLLTVGASLVACGATSSEKPSILLLTLDTTRTDALSAYSPDGAPTTQLDRLAAEGVRFTSAFSCVPMTLPAHASILTGLYPPRHRLRENGGAPLADEALTLAERAKAEGYDTAAFVAAVVLDPLFGLDQGFDEFDGPSGDPAAGAEHGDGQRPGSEVADAALRWLAQRDGKRPFLLWAHFYDPHTPYDTPAGEGCGAADADNALRSQYLRDVCAMDRAVGRLLDALDAPRANGARLADHTLVLAIGDHGEAFGEHSEYGHSAHCFDTTLRVPLLVRLPDGAHAGEVRDDVASLVDVVPTLAALADWGDPEAAPIGRLADLDGRALLGGTGTSVDPEHGVYFESYYGYLNFGWSPITGWLDGAGKYVHTSRDAFFDLASDPGELRNHIADEDLDLHRYRVPVAQLGDAARLPAGESGPSDPDLLASLRGLGYLSSGGSSADLPSPMASSDLPSPLDMAAPYERAIDALGLLQDGRTAEAIPILEEVRRVNPLNPLVLDQLASALLAEQRYAEAEPVLRDLVRASRTPVPSAYTRLAAALEALGRGDEALDAAREAVRLAPGRPRPLRKLHDLLVRLGRESEARELERRMAGQASGG